jgi:pimeloyl-ACP methyl ester carboxylesterase
MPGIAAIVRLLRPRCGATDSTCCSPTIVGTAAIPARQPRRVLRPTPVRRASTFSDGRMSILRASSISVNRSVPRSQYAWRSSILRSPFASLTLVGQFHYPVLPVRLLLRDRFPSIERAPLIQSPVLIIAGTLDTIVPIDHTRRLHDAITAPKAWVEIVADHNDGALLEGDEMIQAIIRFLRRP